MVGGDNEIRAAGASLHEVNFIGCILLCVKKIIIDFRQLLKITNM